MGQVIIYMLGLSVRFYIKIGIQGYLNLPARNISQKKVKRINVFIHFIYNINACPISLIEREMLHKQHPGIL